MASDRLRIMLAQANPTAGDIAGNLELARRALAMGEREGVHLVALPEMFLSGHLLLDLSARTAFVRDCAAAVEALARDTRPGGPGIGLGTPAAGQGGVLNAWALCQDGAVRAQFAKHRLANRGAFDENRIFVEGAVSGPVEIGGVRIGFPIAEDMWFPDVAETLQEAGAELLLVPNGSAYQRGGMDRRILHMVARSVETRLPLFYLNLVGGQDDQVFDGGSFALNPGGSLAGRAPFFEEAFETFEIGRRDGRLAILPRPLPPEPEATELDWHAMVVGVRDYARKSGFSKALLGLSGGIDSALVATIAADALGPDKLRCVRLTSRSTTARAMEDAEALARALGCRLDTLPVDGAVGAVEQVLAPLFAGTGRGTAEQDLQSQLLGLCLTALSNESGLRLTAANKTKLALGHVTTGGDMSGGFNPIRDLWQSRALECARWRNAHHRAWMKGPSGPVIPWRMPTTPHSVEPGTGDSGWEVLDPILMRLVEDDWSTAQITAEGHDPATVQRAQDLLYASEWKRHQSAPGVKLTNKAFGPDRRYPIVNRWRDRS